MQFNDIKFHERGGTFPPGYGLLLPGGYWVLKTTFEQTWKQVCAEFPRLDRRMQYTAELLCNEAFWRTLRCGKRIALGRCVKYFADHNLLPLRVVNPDKKGKRKYVFTDLP